MGNLYDRIKSLCDVKGIKPATMCRNVGISPNIPTELKKGRKKSLNAESANKVASYFGVSVAYLLGEEEKPATKSDGLEGIDLSKASEKQRQLIQNILQLTDPQADALLPMTEALVSRK